MDVKLKAYEAANVIERNSMPDVVFRAIDWKSQMEIAYDLYTTTCIDPIAREVQDDEYCALLQKTFVSLAEDLMESDRKEFAKLPSFEEVIRNTDGFVEEKVTSLYPGYVEEVQRIALDRTKFLGDYVAKQTDALWEGRTIAMIETLERTRLLAISGKTFLIAGESHLIQDSGRLERRSIKLFNDYIAGRADIAILKAKV